MTMYVRKKNDPYVFIASDALLARNDMFACTKDGKLLSGASVGNGGQMLQADTEMEAMNVVISTMSKDQVETYVKDNFGIDLDKRRSVKILRLQAEGLVDGSLSPENVLDGLFEPPIEEEEDDQAEEDEFEVAEEPKVVIPDFNKMTVVAMKKWAAENGIALEVKSRDNRKQVAAKLAPLAEEKFGE